MGEDAWDQAQADQIYLDYDSLDRLTSGSETAGSYGWTYDTDGNRLSQTGTNASTFTMTAATNQLGSASGTLTLSYSYDAAGNVLSDGTRTFSYDNRGRLVGATSSAGQMGAIYNALGQRIEKVNSTTTTVFSYDESGHLIGEYDGSGNMIEETVWLDDLPVATLRPNGTGGINAYYIHADHLNTPKTITRPADNAIMWRWDQDPFGTTSPNQNPSSQGTFVYNVRFRGQYYDQETGLNYNYFRDYDPARGGYIQSDALGLMGGSFSTYAYVGANPVNAIDPYGLWSTAAHNAIIEAYGRQMGLPPDVIQAMEQGSYDTDHGDGYQDAAHSFMHAMSSSKLDKAQACKMLNAFVADSVATANALAAQGDALDAGRDLGFGLHAIMDSTSPVHAGFQQWHWWDFYKHGPFPTSEEGRDSLTQELLQQTIDLMKNAVNGKPLDCSCYGK